MAEKKKVLDVWILDLNTVYREVPYTVVADWLQQGRLLPEDKVRASGQGAWRVLRDTPAFAAFVPRAEPFRAEDQAEALEPVEMGLDWKRPGEADDEDVDMIPLIDISLVLLIFFMMTASITAGFLSPIQTPGAKHQLGEIGKDMYWVGIDLKGGDGQVRKGPEGRPLPWYSLGIDSKTLVEPVLEPGKVGQGLENLLQKTEGEIKVRLRADRSLPIETIKGMTLELQEVERRVNNRREKGVGGLRVIVTGEVSEPQSK